VTISNQFKYNIIQQKHIVLVTSITIYLTYAVQICTKYTAQFLKYKSSKVELKTYISFQYMNAHCFLKPLRKQWLFALLIAHKFSSRNMSYFISLIMWPPNSPDPNLVGYEVWGVLHAMPLLYRTRISDVDHLKHRLVEEWRQLSQDIIHRSVAKTAAILSTNCNRWKLDHQTYFRNCFSQQWALTCWKLTSSISTF